MSATLPITANDRTITLTATFAGQKVFPFDFPVQLATDLLVEVAPAAAPTAFVAQSYAGGAYAVTGVGEVAGGTIRLVYGRSVGDVVRISGAADISRVSSVTRGGKFSSQATDKDLDRTVIIAQEAKRRIDLALTPLAAVLTARDEARAAADRAEAALAAMLAGSVPDGAVTAAKLADGSVSLAKIAAGMSLVISTLTVAAAMVIPVAINAVLVLGHTVEGVGGGTYVYRASPPAHAGWFADALDRCFELVDPIITPQQFGAKADNDGVRGHGTDDTDACENWFNACAIARRKGFIPGGGYRIAQQMLWDIGVQSSTKPAFLPTIEGAGEGICVFWVDQTVASPCIQITNSTGYTTSDQRPEFYGSIRGFTVEAMRTNGIGLLIGGGDRLPSGNTSAYFNGMHFGPIVVANRAASANSIGTLVSGLVNCQVFTTSNGGGVPASHGGGAADFYGIALQIQDCTMTTFGGSVGNARVGIYLTGTGSMFGNRFVTYDFEVVQTCIKCDAVNTTNNVLSGGTTTMCDYVFDVTHGYGFRAEYHLIGDVRLEIIRNHDNDAEGVFGGRGLTLERMNETLIGVVRRGSRWDAGPGGAFPGPGSAVPVQPVLSDATRGTWIRNRWGQDARVYIFSNNDNTLEVYKRSWSDTSSAGSRVVSGAVGTVPVIVKAGEAIRIPAGTALASWLWEAA